MSQHNRSLWTSASIKRGMLNHSASFPVVVDDPEYIEIFLESADSDENYPNHPIGILCISKRGTVWELNPKDYGDSFEDRMVCLDDETRNTDFVSEKDLPMSIIYHPNWPVEL